MRAMALLIAGAAGLAACTDAGNIEVSHTDRNTERAVRALARLDCPEREGRLRLVSAASDGRACAYRGEDGSEVELRLTGADGATELASLEAELRTLVPAAASAPEAPAPPEPPLPPEAPGADGQVTEERTRVSIPGLMDVRTEGERASVRLPGVRVEANGDNADVKIGRRGDEVEIRAHDGGAEIRAREDEKGELTSTFLLASEEAGPAGWRVAGYQARGGGAGPLVVGVIRSREEKHNRLMNDVEDLVDRNVEG